MALINDTSRKWIIAVFSVFLMLAFIPNYINKRENSRADLPYGTLSGGESLSEAEVERAEAEIRILGDRQDKDGRPKLIAEVFRNVELAPGIAELFRKSPHILALLVREAHDQGIVPDRDRIETILQGDPVLMQATNLDAYRSALGSLIMVQQLADSAAQAWKVTRPGLQSLIARQFEALDLRVALFTAADLAQDASLAHPATSPAATTRAASLYDKYKSVLAGEPKADNPFGFGYLLPDRLTFEYISVMPAELTRMAMATSPSARPSTRPDYDWDVEAQKFYTLNPLRYSTERSVPNPITGPNQPATITQHIPKPFADVHQEILRDLYAKKADQLRQQVLHKMSAIMTADFKAFTERHAKASSLGPAYDTFDYLRSLAGKIEKETGIRPNLTGKGTNLVDIHQVQQTPELSSAKDDQPIDLATYLFSHARAFGHVPENSPVTPYELYEPSPVFTNDQGVAIIARVTAAAPERTPPADEIASALAADAALQLTQEKILASAQAFAAANPAAALAGRPIIFAKSVSNEAALPPDLGLSLPSARRFIEEAFNLLRDDPDKSFNRVTINLPADHKVAVVELAAANSVVPAASSSELELYELQQARLTLRYRFLGAFLNPDAVEKRAGFVPTKAPATRKSGPGTTPKAAPDPAPGSING